MSLAARWSLLTLLLAPVIDGGPIPGHRHKAPVRVVDAEGRHRGPTLCLGDLTAVSPRASMRFDDRRALRLCHRIVPGPCPYARPAGVVGCHTPRPLRRSARRRRRVAGGSVERPSTPRWWTPETCPALRSAPGRLVRFEGRVNDQRLVRSAKTGVGHRYFGARGTRFLRADVRFASCICAGRSSNLVAEADGNRTRRGTFVPPPILKACPAFRLPPGL
jgi:hypothetical protein